MLEWIQGEAALGTAALTVQAQAKSAIDIGKRYHPFLFPRVDVASTDLSAISTAQYRPVADRREFNARGRLIPLKTPALTKVNILPIETYFTIDEAYMQKVLEGANGNEAVFRSVVGPDIPTRVNGLVEANLYRMDVDAMRAWALNAITVRNAQGSGADVTVSLGYDAARYPVPSAWTGTPGSGTAWTQFMTHLATARTLMGEIGGTALRQSTMTAIKNTAPAIAAIGQINPMSKKALEERVVDEFGGSFTFSVIEDTVDVFDDGGITTTRTALWPANRVAFIPSGGRVGSTYHAPIARAFAVKNANPTAGISVRDMFVYREISNGGRQLNIECQINALSLPDEQNCYVVDAGI